jgi:hypothetical protein
MWYSNIHGFYARFNANGNNCQYYDFAILGETTNRNDASPDSGFNGQAGTGSRLENIWIEHTKCGYWVGGTSHVSNGLVIHGCRIRDTYADGVNFCNGASNCLAEQNHARNTGDDSFASWSPSSAGVNSNNVLRFNTVQQPWRANCYALYGGNSNKIEDNLCSDTLDYPGILVAQEFNSNAFSGTTSVQRNILTRAGGDMWGTQQGALKISTADASMSGFLFQDLDLIDATYSGIFFEGLNAVNSAQFTNINISNPGTFGIMVAAGVDGTVNCDGVVVTSPGSGGLQESGSATLTFVKGTGNSGW